MTTVILTGATGFLGSYIARALIENGVNVIAFKRKKSQLSRLNKISNKIIFYDIENCDLNFPFKSHGKIDAVIHTSTTYGRENNDASEVVLANTVFPLRLLEIALNNKVDIFINTDTFFAKFDSCCGYLDAYTLSKKQFTDWGRQLIKNSPSRFVNLRLEHVYGPGDNDDKFISSLIRRLVSDEPEIELTKGEQKRDFIYIEDVVSAFLIVLKNRKLITNSYEEFEVGAGVSTSIKKLIETVHRIASSKSILKFGALPYRESEIMDSYACNSKLKSMGWNCITCLDFGLANAINWEIQRIKIDK